MSKRQAWLTRTGEGGDGLAECIRQGVVAIKATDVANRFEKDLQVGDIVVTPHSVERRVFFGEVTGAYEYEEPSRVPFLPHLRAVRWLGDVARDAIPADTRKEIDTPSTFYLLTSGQAWLDRADAAIGDVIAPKPRLSSAPPSPRAPKPIEAVKAKCTVCNMTVTPTDLLDGVCDFCR